MDKGAYATWLKKKIELREGISSRKMFKRATHALRQTNQKSVDADYYLPSRLGDSRDFNRLALFAPIIFLCMRLNSFPPRHNKCGHGLLEQASQEQQ